MTVVARIFDLFDRLGREAYLRKGVSQREHALQAAALAEAEGAAPALVLAALLHDIGHLLAAQERARDDAQRVHRLPHERIGAGWLEPLFGPAIAESVRLHVEAKRYLCAVEPGYARQLREPARRRLAMQGGALTRSEIREFQENPYHRAAVWLRRIDDRACDASRTDLSGFDRYRERLETALILRQLAVETARRGDAFLGRAHCHAC